MKKRTLFISIIISIALFTSAQVPQKFNYQAVVRNSQNAVLANQSVGFKMSVLKGSINGEVIYAESHDITTNPIGLAELLIGDGGVISDSFSDINWTASRGERNLRAHSRASSSASLFFLIMCA